MSTPLNARSEASGLSEGLLQLDFGGRVGAYLEPSLWGPVNDLLQRPSKKIRGDLVRIGLEAVYGTGGQSESMVRQREACVHLMEELHAGSLIIDDIEDNSTDRRGQPTIHRKYGIPVALNAGNWLYFWPLHSVRGIQLSPEQELAIYRAYHSALLRAHFGQALDVGVPIDQIPQMEVRSLCLASLELKSGILTSLALVLGAIVAGAEGKQLQSLERFGRGFGMALQMYDDLGNLVGEKDPRKKWEDLRLRRPSWVWACFSSHFSPVEYQQFCESVKDLENQFGTWLKANKHWVDHSYQEATNHLDSILEPLVPFVTASSLARLRGLADKLKGSYV